ncbi:ArsR/SmtB family transcription factor [Streptantibioticus rubrisoli]|uniref:Helix-turn-helix domain-containing protein n=1 Tax=Streptantibioticus rubrisoli TaxID=1387313 RepID=A0ABT1PBN1_9ACTN|nr:helix-turn-helix domain-containing protein [Streptantibioticus rubrisoli]MCQ4042772.1 helix-turn-helix domain-containing protein [Streptantibioticus rubrisoli]
MYFTLEDLLRVTLATEPAPLMELGLATAMLQRPGTDPVLGRWRQRTLRIFPRSARPLLELIPPTGKGPLFLDPLSQGLDEGLDLVRSSSPSFVRADLARLCKAGRPQTWWITRLAHQDRDAWQLLEDAVRSGHASLLAPAWHRIASAFDAEQAWRAHILAQHGIQATLTSLACGIRWAGTVMEIVSPEEREIHLAGRGITLLPSVFWTGRPLVGVYPRGPAVFVYPAITPLTLLPEPSTADPVAVLLGSTRAAVLALLTRERTTTDVARELGISKSSASEHTKALRHARLVVSKREGQAVWHTCTLLGLGLLNQSGAINEATKSPPPLIG